MLSCAFQVDHQFDICDGVAIDLGGTVDVAGTLLDPTTRLAKSERDDVMFTFWDC
jgi:hypothetical protein